MKPCRTHLKLPIVLAATLAPIAYVSSAAAATCPAIYNLQGTSLGTFCLGTPPACPANTNCVAVTDPNYGDYGAGQCTIDEALNMISSGQPVDQCKWVRALNTSYPYAILLPGSYTGTKAPKPPVVYSEPEGLGMGQTPSITIIGSDTFTTTATGTTTTTNSEIELGNFDFLSGIYLGDGTLTSLTVTGFPGPYDTNYGPGASCVDIGGTATLNGVTINNCGPSATGLVVESSGNATVQNYSTITNNTFSSTYSSGEAGNAWGGGILVNGGIINVTNSTISNNKTPHNGAGIAMYGGTLTMTGSAVQNNMSSAGNGGGISFDADATGNYSVASISYSSITGNSALSGGGLAVIAGSPGAFSTSLDGLLWDTIATNKATNGYGGGVYYLNACSTSCDTAALSGEHDTVVYNTSTKGGGGVYITGGNSPNGGVYWDGSVFAYNTTNNVGDDYDGAIRINCEEWQEGADSNLVQNTIQDNQMTGSAWWNPWLGPWTGTVDGLGCSATQLPGLSPIGDVYGKDPLLGKVAMAKNGTQYYSPAANSPAVTPGGNVSAAAFMGTTTNEACSVSDGLNSITRACTVDQIGNKAPANGTYYCLGSIEVVSPPQTGCASGATVLSETSCSSFPSFNTTGAVCVKVKVNTVNGWNASNVSGRTATAKGSTTHGPITPTNGSIPNQPGLSAGSDGYVYFNFTAGSLSYAAMACW